MLKGARMADAYISVKLHYMCPGLCPNDTVFVENEPPSQKLARFTFSALLIGRLLNISVVAQITLVVAKQKSCFSTDSK